MISFALRLCFHRIFFLTQIPFEIPLASVYKGVQGCVIKFIICRSYVLVKRAPSRLLKDCDGILTVSAHAWEGDAIAALRAWFSKSGKSLFALGPLLPSTFGTLQESHRGADDVKDFLDSMLGQKGEKSVLLVRLTRISYQ